jgi:hypothetical protein
LLYMYLRWSSQLGKLQVGYGCGVGSANHGHVPCSASQIVACARSCFRWGAPNFSTSFSKTPKIITWRCFNQHNVRPKF